MIRKHQVIQPGCDALQATDIEYEADVCIIDGQRAYDASDAATGLRMEREQVCIANPVG
jgi:hypothetical protein